MIKTAREGPARHPMRVEGRLLDAVACMPVPFSLSRRFCSAAFYACGAYSGVRDLDYWGAGCIVKTRTHSI
jgi:hypothetical protein